MLEIGIHRPEGYTEWYLHNPGHARRLAVCGEAVNALWHGLDEDKAQAATLCISKEPVRGAWKGETAGRFTAVRLLNLGPKAHKFMDANDPVPIFKVVAEQLHAYLGTELPNTLMDEHTRNSVLPSKPGVPFWFWVELD